MKVSLVCVLNRILDKVVLLTTIIPDKDRSETFGDNYSIILQFCCPAGVCVCGGGSCVRACVLTCYVNTYVPVDMGVPYMSLDKCTHTSNNTYF